MEEKSKKDLENEKRRLRYQKNKEKILQANKDWRDNNKEKLVRPGHYEKYKESYKKSAEKNKDRITTYRKKWTENNKDLKKKLDKEWRDNNKEKVSDNKKEYRKNNREKLRIHKAKYEKKKRNTDPLYKLKSNVRRFIALALKKKNYNKNSRTHLILGCSYEEFKQHLESQWEPWMSWDNYGLYNGIENYGWDIDHIIPVSSAKDEKGVIALNHYTNLRPLCSYYNRVIKWNRMIN